MAQCELVLTAPSRNILTYLLTFPQFWSGWCNHHAIRTYFQLNNTLFRDRKYRTCNLLTS